MGKHSKGKHYKRKHNRIDLIQIILAITIITCIVQIVKWINDNGKSNYISKELKNAINVEETIGVEDTEIEKYSIDFEKLKNVNQDVVGWLKINNTNIDYPVVKTIDNSYYLNHSFDKTENKAGWIFANFLTAFDETDKNISIFGHNMRSGTMFGTLENVLQEGWYNNAENQYITVTTEKTTNIYKIFSIYTIKAEDYYIQNNFKSDSEYKEFVQTLQSRSIKDFEMDEKLEQVEQILTISTCADNNAYRVVVHAMKID